MQIRIIPVSGDAWFITTVAWTDDSDSARKGSLCRNGQCWFSMCRIPLRQLGSAGNHTINLRFLRNCL